jgi:hypothetical protein
MRKIYKLIGTFLAIIIFALLTLINIDIAYAAQVSTVRNATDAPLVEHITMYRPDTCEIEMLAKVTWGEARGCSRTQQAAVMWSVFNRVDSPQWPDTVAEVIVQPGQFAGWNERHPVTDELLDLAYEVTNQWIAEKFGEESGRVLPKEYVYFTGDGSLNIFKTKEGDKFIP